MFTAPAADRKIPVAPGAPAKQLPGKGPEPGDGVRVHPAARNQALGEWDLLLSRAETPCLPAKGAEPAGAEIHLPELHGRLFERGPEPLDLLLLPLLHLFEPGDVHRGEEHHRHAAVVLGLRGADLPPAPALPVPGTDAACLLHALPPAQPVPQRIQERIQIVRMEQLGQRPGHRTGIRIGPDDSAQAGADVDHLGALPHLQQRHTALHLLQQAAEGYGADRAEAVGPRLLIAVLPFQAESVFSGLLGLVKGQVSRLVQALKRLPPPRLPVL